MIRGRRSVTMGPMRRTLLLPLLLTSACAAASPVEEGDRLFRLERYVEAFASYQEAAADGARGPELQARLDAARYEMVVWHARELLHVDQPQRCLEVLAMADRLRPGAPSTAALRQRCHVKLAIRYAELGRDLYGDERPDEALAAYEQALAYDPANALAGEGIGLARERLAAREKLGEEYFFLGLAEMDLGADERALTAFQHASTHWGEDSRAAEWEDDLAQLLARRSLVQAREYLGMGLIGPAWMALRDADHLRPGVPEVEQHLAELEAAMLADLDLDSAELALLGGYPERALEAVEAAAARRAAGVEGRTEQLRSDAEALRVQQLYTRARACEIDGLLVRATGLLERIVEAGLPGYEDVPPRLEEAQARVAAAAEHYRRALEAEAQGDRAAYLEQLRASVTSARDYRDASRRLRGLTTTQE
jgi:hypothetical protein